MNQFFPQTERDARREEFEQLVQGSLSVSLCESRFADLSRYAADLVDTEYVVFAWVKTCDSDSVGSVETSRLSRCGGPSPNHGKGVHREATKAVREEDE